MVTLFVLLFLAGPPLCWALMARTAPVGLAVGLPLAGWSALLLAVHLDWIDTRARAELYLAELPLSVLLVAAGLLAERRLRGPRRKQVLGDRASGARIAFGSYLALFGLLVPGYLWFAGLSDDVPPADELRPLAAGLALHGVRNECTETGSAGCTLQAEVSGAGLSRAEVAARLRDSLNARGWRLAEGQDHGCRRNGWLVDRRQLCFGEDADPAAPDSVLVEMWIKADLS
ncbi:hypothetical protein ACFYNO_07490 [Kitasatospora sp. NPDC006697]|uniref:hypothetical protein n=1 Tax=Kitasatospora sp. NPDC006697 TaxID=3364020 RepID=UPI003682EB82